jgi:esterase/lipase superfamily enzyme
MTWLYSWPSAGREKAYLKDEESVKLTKLHLKKFLEDVMAHGAPRKLHLVAHSMGNRALTDALTQFAAAAKPPVFNEIILAAPDVNQPEFLTQILPAMRGTGERITLYASSDDVPLKLSRKFHDFPRAGEGLPHLVVADGLETIDASGIDTDMLGHSYFAQARRVLSDLARVICQSHRAMERDLVPVELAGKPYWRIK